MGGRGSHFGVQTMAAVSATGLGNGPVTELHVAGMTPTDRGSRFTSAEKTLDYLEKKKLAETKEQLQVLDEYGYVTRAFQGDEHSVAVDARTREYMKGKIVTHNHPSVYGGTFSDADINCLSMGMRELRASAREGTYSMKRHKDADPKGFMKAYLDSADRLQERMYQKAVDVAREYYHSREDYEKINRREQLQVIHEWYSENAPRYGYTYTFTPAGEQNN